MTWAARSESVRPRARRAFTGSSLPACALRVGGQRVLALARRQLAGLVAAADERQADLRARRSRRRSGAGRASAAGRRSPGTSTCWRSGVAWRRRCRCAPGRARAARGSPMVTMRARRMIVRALAGERVCRRAEGGQHVDAVARAQLAGHAGVGVDEDRDLLLALLERRRLDRASPPAARRPPAAPCSARARRSATGRAAPGGRPTSPGRTSRPWRRAGSAAARGRPA